MKRIGIVLLLAGAFFLLLYGLSPKRQRQAIRVGPARARIQDERSVPRLRVRWAMDRGALLVVGRTARQG